MHFDWWTFALQTINFAILVWLLHRFLYRPVLRLIDTRRHAIEKQFADARSAEEKANAQLADITAQRAKIDEERAESMRAAGQQAAEMMRTGKEEAQKQAVGLLDEARKKIVNERDQALDEARRGALDLAAELTRRLIAELPMDQRAETWLKRIEDYFSGLPDAERTALVNQVADGAVVKVLTAASLSDAARQAWRDRLKTILGSATGIEFAVDANLIAGAELHLPEAILRFSLQSALASLRAETEGHGNTCRRS